MVRRMTFRRLTSLTLGLLAPAALGLSATPAHAAGETLSLAQTDPAAVAGRATNFTASGTLNPDDTMFGFDVYVFLKDPNRDPTCAADFDSESATALHSGGYESWVSPAGGFEVGMGPTFNYPFKITFTGGGDYLLCGYVDGDFSTFASGQLRGVVGSAPAVASPPAVALPVAVRTPWITRRRHVLTCHPGTWSNSPSGLSYRWYAKGRGPAVGSRRTLTVGRALRGRMVSCRVTAANAAGRGT